MHVRISSRSQRMVTRSKASVETALHTVPAEWGQARMRDISICTSSPEGYFRLFYIALGYHLSNAYSPVSDHVQWLGLRSFYPTKPEMEINFLRQPLCFLHNVTTVDIYCCLGRNLFPPLLTEVTNQFDGLQASVLSFVKYVSTC